MARKKLVVIDGYSLLYRAFFATRYLSTADGRPTNALYSFANMLFKLLEDVRPDAFIVALDAPGKTFRHSEYAEYKGTRRETPEELKAQFPVARELISALGIQSIELTGYEADDVVGTISADASGAGYDTIIVTGDLDSLQLVDEHVRVLTMKQGVTDTFTYDVDAVVERYGFGPELIPDYKAIVGDTSDNIPGTPGIGQKGATELLVEFGGIESILSKFDELPAKYQKKITGQEEQMRMSRWLATIVRNAPVEIDFEPFELTPDQLKSAKAWLESVEFRTHVRRADAVFGPYLKGGDRSASMVEVEAEPIEANLEQCADFGKLSNWVGEGYYAVLVGPAPVSTDLFNQEEPKVFVSKGNDVKEIPLSMARQLVSENPSRAVFHDSKLFYHGLEDGLPAPAFDTALAGYVLQPGRSLYALRDLVQGYLDVAVPETLPQMSVALGMLYPVLLERLEKEQQHTVCQDIELPLIPILCKMEKLGICVSRKQLQDFSLELEKNIERISGEIFEDAGVTFTIGSPKQLGEVLFEKMGLPGGQKNKTGWATGVEVLQQLEASYPIVGKVLYWREISKLKSTYTDGLEKLIGPDGRIHTTYNQTVAATGRLSSIDPNLQNIPIRTELGRGIRKAFYAAEGYKLLSIDYSQIELRVLAHLCKDEALVRAFTLREDVHTVTAQQTFGLGGETPSKEQRRLAKMLNYAALYGVTDFGLAQQLGAEFSVSEARALLAQYFERFPSVHEYTQMIVAEARSKGFTTTLRGRRRYFPDIHAAKMNERKAAERQAMNAPIQGTAADMLKLAMISVQSLLQGTRSRMLLNVHDELVFELAKGEEDLVEPICVAMEQALPLDVPVEVDAKIGNNWNEMEKLTR